MNFISDLIMKFFDKEKYKTILLLIISLLIEFLKINGASHLIATLQDSFYRKNFDDTTKYYKYFIILVIGFTILFVLYRYYQAVILTNLHDFIKYKMINNILLTNNSNFNSMNFTKINYPLFRVSNSMFAIFNDIFNTVIPNIMVMIAVSIFLLYTNKTIGLIFILGNIINSIYVYYSLDKINNIWNEYDKYNNNLESFIVDILTNINKIIFRGNINKESDKLTNKLNDVRKQSIKYFETFNSRSFVISLLYYIMIFVIVAYLIHLLYKGSMEPIACVTIISVLLMYNDKISTTLTIMPDIINFVERVKFVIGLFDDMDYNKEIVNKEYETYDLNFDNIKFQNINFGYKKSNKMILNDFNLELITNNIIGLTGTSGAGKTTFIKLLLKMYNYDGTISIDDVNLENINPEYIRKNIVYIDQNATLFDMSIKENILYGCNENVDDCTTKLYDLSQFPMIKALLEKINNETDSKDIGMLGSNLSGGQKQIINIVNGLILPAKIVVLDEPTNSLDIELKKEVIDLIKYFRRYKKCIMIISHDKDVFPIFDVTVNLQ